LNIDLGDSEIKVLSRPPKAILVQWENFSEECGLHMETKGDVNFKSTKITINWFAFELGFAVTIILETPYDICPTQFYDMTDHDYE